MAFPVLLSIAVIDSATRMAFLTFLPFVLLAKGAGLPAIGLALTLVFAGGAAGKLVCAFSVFYTGSIGAGATAPAIYGLLGDALGIDAALVVVAAIVLLTLPLALVLKPVLPRGQA